MTDLFLKLLGAEVDDAVHLAGASLAFRGGLDVGWYVFLLLVTAAMVGWIYRASPVPLSPARRYALTVLRVLFIALQAVRALLDRAGRRPVSLQCRRHRFADAVVGFGH